MLNLRKISSGSQRTHNLHHGLRVQVMIINFPSTPLRLFDHSSGSQRTHNLHHGLRVQVRLMDMICNLFGTNSNTTSLFKHIHSN